MINDTLNTRIGIPLNTLVKTVNRIEDPEKLLKIEQVFHGKIDLRYDLQILKNQCKLIIFSLRDMQDYRNLKKGNFRKKTQKFNLKDALSEVINIVKYKGSENSNKFIFEPEFNSEMQEKSDLA